MVVECKEIGMYLGAEGIAKAYLGEEEIAKMMYCYEAEPVDPVFVTAGYIEDRQDPIGTSRGIMAVMSYTRSGVNWTKSYYISSEDPDSQYVYNESDLIETIDKNNYLVSGHLYKSAEGTQPCILKLYKATGSVEWCSLITPPAPINSDHYVYSITEASDGNIYLATQSYRINASSSAWIFSYMKFNSTGTLVWQKMWGDANNAINSAAQSVIELSSGNILVGGWSGIYNQTGTTSGILIEVSPTDGSVIWSKQYEDLTSTDTEAFYRIKEVSDGIIAIGKSAGGMLIVKTDLLGEVLWSVIPAGEYGKSYSVGEVADGYIFSNLDDRFVFKLSLSGAMVWQKKIKNVAGSDFGPYGMVLTDTGVGLTGYIYEGGYFNGAMHIDLTGGVSSCEAFITDMTKVVYVANFSAAVITPVMNDPGNTITQPAITARDHGTTHNVYCQNGEHFLSEIKFTNTDTGWIETVYWPTSIITHSDPASPTIELPTVHNDTAAFELKDISETDHSYSTQLHCESDVHFISEYTPLNTTPPGWIETSFRTKSMISCSVTKDLYIFGRNFSGEFGIGHQDATYTPIQHPTLNSQTILQFAENCFGHMLIVKTDNTIWGAGQKYDGQLGISNNPEDSFYQYELEFKQEDRLDTDWAFVTGTWSHSIAIKTNGTLWTTGYQSYGCLGLGPTVTNHTRIYVFTQEITGKTDFVYACAGMWVSAAIDSSGRLFTAGYEWGCGLGTDGSVYNIDTFQEVTALGPNVQKVVLGDVTIAALLTNGTIWVSGSDVGDLGLGEARADDWITTWEQEITYSTEWVDLAMFWHSILAIKSDGTLWATGMQNGELGTGNWDSLYQFTQIGTDTDWERVYMSEYWSVAIKTNGSVWFCGSHGYVITSPYYPHERYKFTKLFDWTVDRFAHTYESVFTEKISDGDFINPWEPIPALPANPILYGFGINSGGQLGIYDFEEKYVPTASYPEDISQISIGSRHCFILTSLGKILASGRRDRDALGLRDYDTVPYFVELMPETTWAKIFCGYDTSYAIKNDGTIWGSGRSSYDLFGPGFDAMSTDDLVQVDSDTDWIDIVSGYNAAIATKPNGSIYGLGYNRDYQLGISVTTVSVFTLIDSNSWSKVSMGSYGHTLFLKSDGTLWGCGKNSVGQLGLGSVDLTARQVITSLSVDLYIDIAAGYDFSVVIKSDGTMWSTGSNGYGRGCLGLGTLDGPNIYEFTQIGTDTDWEKILIMGRAAYAMKTNGKVYSWGDNAIGRLGLGDTIHRGSPTLINDETYSMLPTGYIFASHSSSMFLVK